MINPPPPFLCFIRLRGITENSSGQISNGFGSCNNNNGSVVAECTGSMTSSSNNGGVVTTSTAAAVGSSGIYFPNYRPTGNGTGGGGGGGGLTGMDKSSQNNVGGANGMSGPMRHHYLMSKQVRMGRRVSDGGPYVAAYKLYIEKRSPQLTQIRSNSNIDKADSGSVGLASSVKMLLQDKTTYGGLPNSHRGEWMHYKNQVRERRGWRGRDGRVR